MNAREPDAAIAAFDSSRSIFEALYRGGEEDQHTNIAACDVKLGEASAQAARDGSAADYFHRALTVVKPLLIAAQDTDPDALYAAADAYSGLGELSMKRARQPGTQQRNNWAEAQSWFSRSLNAWRRIEHPNHTAPNTFQAGDPVTVAKELRLTEAALASLHYHGELQLRRGGE